MTPDLITIEASHAPSFYLSDEAEAKRLAKLIRRIASEGLRPGEAVPARIMAAARATTPNTQDRRHAA